MAESNIRIQELTKAELEIMQVIWRVGREFVVRDIGGSISTLVNYFSSRKSISVQETDEILKILDEDKK